MKMIKCHHVGFKHFLGDHSLYRYELGATELLAMSSQCHPCHPNLTCFTYYLFDIDFLSNNFIVIVMQFAKSFVLLWCSG